MIENRAFIEGVYHSVQREQIENYLYRVVYDLLFDVVRELAAPYSIAEEDEAYITNFYKYAFVGVMLDWVRHDMRDDPQKMVENINLIMHENILNALERYRNDKT